MTFAFIERQAARRSASRGVEPVGDRESAVGEVRRAAAVAAARPGRRVRAQPPARAARRPAVRDRHALHAAPAKTRGRRSRGPAPRRRRTGPAAARTVDFFDVKGVVELLCAALGVDASTFAAGARRRISSRAGRPTCASGDGRRSASSASWRRRSPTRAGFPAARTIFVAELDLDALARARRRRRPARASRCRAIPSIVRDLSIARR